MKLIEGKAKRPPEDVGGLHVFNEYLTVINDTTFSEYENMMAWAESQKERTLSLKYTNYLLRSIMHNYRYFDDEHILENEDFLSRLKLAY